MKVLFTVPGKSVSLADKARMIFAIGQGAFDDTYCDAAGKSVPAEDGFVHGCEFDDEDPWQAYWIEYEGLDEKLISESVEEIQWEIDDGFGKFGFKNRAGEFVIEPQFAYANEFTCGLAAVNLNRTWYRSQTGQRYYENHFGYINGRGETVIPFMYDEAYPFNKYGVAVVATRQEGSRLIDTSGNVVPGTEGLDFICQAYDYNDRYYELNKNVNEMEGLVGIYDTKERRVVLEPSVSGFTEWSEDLIEIYDDGEDGQSTQYYVNSKGEKLYPWLLDKGFAIVERPNASLLTVVAFAHFEELSGNPSSYVLRDGKKYDRTYLYGLYSSKERFIIPAEYERIVELTDRIFGCVKDGRVTVVQVEDADV